MDEFLPKIHPGRLVVVVAPRSLARSLMTAAAARLALRGPVDLLDGGNSVDAYGLARLIRRQTPELDAALKRVQAARSFTAYQMLALLRRAPATPHPKLVCDLLANFYDDSIPPAESLRLLELGIQHLERLNRLAPVVVTARPPQAAQPERRPLFDRLLQAAPEVLTFEPPPEPRALKFF